MCVSALSRHTVCGVDDHQIITAYLAIMLQRLDHGRGRVVGRHGGPRTPSVCGGGESCIAAELQLTLLCGPLTQKEPQKKKFLGA